MSGDDHLLRLLEAQREAERRMQRADDEAARAGRERADAGAALHNAKLAVREYIDGLRRTLP